MFKRILPKHTFYAYPVSRCGLSWSKHHGYYRQVDDLAPYLRDDPLLFNLWNSGGMGEALQHQTRAQLLSGQTLLAQLFRLALQKEPTLTALSSPAPPQCVSGGRGGNGH